MGVADFEPLRPLGFLGLLYTPTAMVIAQAIITSPIVTGFTIAAIQSLNPKIRTADSALGVASAVALASFERSQAWLLAAVIAGFEALFQRSALPSWSAAT